MKSRNPIPSEFDVRSVLKKAMRKTGKTQSFLAKKTDRSPTTVMHQLKRRSIQASILYEYSLALKTDLFRELSNLLPEEIRRHPAEDMVQQKEKEISELKEELAGCKEEIRYMKKVVDLLHASQKE